MRKERIKVLMALCAMVFMAAQCAQAEDTAAAKATECTTELTGYATGTYQALCSPEAGAGRFFVLQGLNSAAVNGFAYIFVGYTSTPASASSFAAGQYALISGRSNGPVSFSYFRNATATYSGSEANGSATPDIYAASNVEVCAEFVPAAGSAPRVIFWVTGQNGANCASRTNLTQATALVNYAAFSDTTNALTLGQAYYRFNNTALLSGTKIIVSSKSNF